MRRWHENIPLLELFESLFDRGSLLYDLDSPGEYGSDLSSARPKLDVHVVINPEKFSKSFR